MVEIQSILLIDDDEATNFLHKREISKSEVNTTVDVVENGEEGINFIKDLLAAGKSLPSLIFLDINMPRMNGWEFLEEYEKITSDLGLKSNIVVMLTTSLNPDDEQKAKSYKAICKYLTKPLRRAQLPEIITACAL